MSNLPEVTHIRLNTEKTEKAIQACLRNRRLILGGWTAIEQSMTPATASQIDEHLSWLDEFLVQEAGKRNRTNEQYKKYLLGWVAVLQTIPADITAWAFGQWLETDTAFYPTPGQIKALAQERASKRIIFYSRMQKAVLYLRDHPNAKPFKEGPQSEAMRGKMADLAKDIAAKVQPELLEANASKRKRRVKTLNEIKAMQGDDQEVSS